MANPFPTLVNLDDVALGTGGFKIQGENASDAAGISVSGAGDVNGDGLDDLIVGAIRNNSGGFAGAAYVVYGRQGGITGLVDLDAVALGTGGFKIQGENGGDQAGNSVSDAGDVNGDGLADLIVGAYMNDSGGNSAGAAYVIYGRQGGISGLVDLDAVAAGTGGFKIQGENAVDRAGRSVSAAGDVNGDGLDDLIVGANLNDSGGGDAGAAYVVYGRQGGITGLVNLDAVAAGTGGFKVQGENGGDFAGSSVSAAGDVNGDGLADLVVGAIRDDSGGSDAGAAYVVYGRQGEITDLVDLDAVAAGTGGFKIQAENLFDYAGWSVSAAGDVNGDGLDDLIVGAFRNDSGGGNAGAAYVVYGRQGGITGLVDLDAIALGTGGFKIQGENAADGAGRSVSAAGDVNGDGLADLIVTATGNDSGGDYAGAAYVIYGRQGGITGLVNLDAVALGTGGFKIQGENAADGAGISVSAAGDVDGDGLADLIVGANGNDSGGNASGAAYVVYGRRETITAQADSAGGTSDNDVIDLLAGDDYYDGRAGNDTITGNAGADWLRGNVGDDVFQLGGSAGADLVAGNGATVRNADMVNAAGLLPDAVAVNGRAITLDILDGGEGNDLVVGTGGADVVVLSAPGSAVYADPNANARIASVEGFELGDGNDVLSLTTTSATKYTTAVTALGGEGNDVLWSGSGADVLDGGIGNDNLVGGFGNDLLTGGAGADVFGFSRGFGTDTVTDFTQGQDKLRIKGFGTARDSFAEVAPLISTGEFDAVAGLDTRIDLSAQGTTILLRSFTGTLVASDFQFVA